MSSSGLCADRVVVLVHELRSPVAALTALAEALPETHAGESRRELVRLALSACRAIERVVVDVAVASVRAEPMDVRALVHETVASYAVRGDDIEAEVSSEPLRTAGDHVRLRQAVDNLVANALAYGEGARVVIRALHSGDSVRIEVSDEGPGVPADEVARIFEPGVRLASDRAGSGIGLALARAIVVAHGGTLEVESASGIGSTFTIALPALVST